MLKTRKEESNPAFYSDLACCMNTSTLNMCISMTYDICRINQAEYGIRILVAAPQEYVNIYSTRRLGGLLTADGNVFVLSLCGVSVLRSQYTREEKRVRSRLQGQAPEVKIELPGSFCRNIRLIDMPEAAILTRRF